MSEIEYEYRLAPDDRTVVEVRKRPEFTRHPQNFTSYMRCRSEEDASRILWMLQRPENERERVVLP